MAKLWFLSELRVTTEGHLRFEVMGKRVQMGHVCLEQEQEVSFGTVWMNDLCDALAPYAKGHVEVGGPRVAALFKAEWDKYEAATERACPGFRERYPMLEELGSPVMFLIDRVVFRACRNVDGNISACICDRVDWSVVQTMLRSDEAGNVTLIRVEPQDTNSIMESGK